MGTQRIVALVESPWFIFKELCLFTNQPKVSLNESLDLEFLGTALIL